ncbi:MAG TPA: hypothetical protein VIL09_12385 [Microvirga sp.]|jgi:hypothetical protein
MAIGRYFIIGLLVFGVVAGLVVATQPGIRAWAIPPLAWPLILALVVDLLLFPFVREGRIRPLTMNERAIGVIGSGLISTAIVALA